MNRLLKNQKGFSLIEMIVALFVFSLIMIVVTSVFTNVMKSQKRAREVQQDLESARGALELMDKNIRMSSKTSASPDKQTIYMYNNSQQQCISYQFSNEQIRGGVKPPSDPNNPDCVGSFDEGDYYYIISDNISSGRFNVTQTVSGSVMGKATISVQVKRSDSASSNDVAKIETTVSFRDY